MSCVVSKDLHDGTRGRAIVFGGGYLEAMTIEEPGSAQLPGEGGGGGKANQNATESFDEKDLTFGDCLEKIEGAALEKVKAQGVENTGEAAIRMPTVEGMKAGLPGGFCAGYLAPRDAGGEFVEDEVEDGARVGGRAAAGTGTGASAYPGTR
jgi:hypothetical protein